ncbi:hypothetical protein LguiB_009429 [Lonicera macranthoides]
MLSQLQIPVVYVEDGSNLPPKHPPTIPSLNIQQFPPLPSRQKTVAVGLSAQCTDSVTMQTVSAAPVYSNPTAAQGSMPASSCTYTQTSTSHIPPHTLAVTNLDSSTVNHTSSPIPTKANFASLFHHSELTTPIPLAPLPTSYSKGSLPAIKLNEEVYQKSILACQLNLIGRLTLPKGSSPIKTSDLYSKINSRWQTSEKFILTPIGKGFFCLRFKSKADQNKAWIIGHLNLSPGSFRLQLWSKDFNPVNQKKTTTQIWIKLHEITQEYWDPQMLISIASLVGIPQAIDPHTMGFVFGHFARMQVEVDLLHPLPSRLLVEREGYSFEVPVSYESVPSFCLHCHTIGHLVGECRSLKKVQEASHNDHCRLPSSNKNSKAALPANLQQTTKSDSRQKKVAFMPTVSVPSSPPTIPIISTSDPPTNHANTNLDHSPSKFVSVSHNSQSNPVQSSDSAEHTNASETNSHKAVLPSSNSSFTQHSPSPCLNRSLTNQSVTLSNSVDNDWDGKPLPQFRTHSMRSSQSNYGISTSDSHTQQFTRSRHNNKYSPFSEHLLDDDGDGEAWDHSSEENYIENQEHFNDCSGFYSLANSNQFIAVHRPPVLNVQEALNWENMADDEPFQSWEARADAEFEAAVAKNNDEEGIVSPPHGNSHISISSHGSTSKGGLEYVPSPVQTRAQRQKKGTTLSLNKKNKLKKASSREKKEVEAAAPGKPPKEAQSNSLSSSQPLYQWQVHLQDKKKR